MERRERDKMQKIKWIAAGLLILAVVVKGAGSKPETVSTQDAFSSINLEPAVPIQAEPISMSATDMPSLRSLSDAQLETFMNALDATPTIAFDALPRKGRVGTFYSLQYPAWPPLPGNTSQSSVWQMNDFYLLNDVNFNYDAPQKGSLKSGGSMQAMALSGPPGFGDGGGSTNSGMGGASYQAQVFTTNDLWLQIIAVTNHTASLVIHPPWNVTNEVYDLLYCTNLVPPIAWQWLLRSDPGQTNLIVPNATDAQGFYRLGPPNDLTANDSLGTNFWVAFCGLYENNNNKLSLSISSPVGATGTVITPGLWANGPILIVTNCGDATVNGTYVLTNLSNKEQNDFGVSAPTGYVNGTNWVVFQGTTWILLAYDTNAGGEYLYDKPGVNLNGSAADWLYDGDPGLPTPTTVCAQVLLVNRSFSVAAGAVTNINIPLPAMMTNYDMVTTNGIHITASQPVSVYGLDYAYQASTAFTGYPTPLLGTNYCVMACASMMPYASYGNSCYSQLAIVATASNTTVTIKPSTTANLEGHTNAYFTITNLQQGQTYQINSRNDTDDAYTNDVTGTLITSDKPIAVFAGDNVAHVPDENTLAANPLVQEQMPVDSWGRQALALGFAGRTGGDSYRVLAACSNTVITISGAVVTVNTNDNTITSSNEVIVITNQAGQFYDIIVDGPVQFQSSQPIQVAKFSNGAGFGGGGNQEGDPCEILLLPTGHWLETNTVVTLDNINEDFDENFMNLIVSQSAITNTFVDTLPVAATNFVAIGRSGYYGAQITVTNSGVHKITSSAPVGVEVYGFGTYDAYGYFGGVVK